MKKLLAFTCAAMMAFGTVATAAGPSITAVIEPTVTVVEGSTGKVEGAVVVAEADTSAYANEDVKKAVELMNDSKETPKMEELAAALKLESTEIEISEDKKLDLKEYSAVSVFMDLCNEEGEKFTMTEKGTIIAEITTDVLKDVKEEDLKNFVILFVDPETGDVKVIELAKDAEAAEDAFEVKFDAETGKLTVEFPGLGAFMILEKTEALTAQAEAAAEETTEAVTEAE